MEKVVIAGGTGFLGLSLAKHLSERGFHPILMARNKPKSSEFEFVQWDATSLGEWSKSLEDAKAIVNLTGRTVDCIKTPENCDAILRSRVESTRVIAKALGQLGNPPKVWVQMSTAHIYGDPQSIVCDEDSAEGYGLAPIVGKAWEKALLDNIPEGIREVRLRTSFVIGKNGGALVTLKKIVKMGLGGKVGDGTQGISWLHEYDMNNLILESIINPEYNGYYIASSPYLVSNNEFMRTLRKKMKMPIGLIAPNFMIRFGSKFIFKTDPELVLYGRYVVPKRLLEQGYKFKFPDLDSALKDLI
ncbi:MAG: TIGR01777 family protein [Ignavibacteriae bacterium HGW-Ignavibacteriae-4]|nr:MAG: TIGR01777 family protein [Ignavibacteriae bacterium HGW-Ignavibacteriae-4]